MRSRNLQLWPSPEDIMSESVASRSGGRGQSSSRGWHGYRGHWRGRGGYGRGRLNTNPRPETGPSQVGREPRLIQTPLYKCPYAAWSTYLPDEAYAEGSTADRNVHAFHSYFTRQLPQYNLEDIELKGSRAVDYSTLITDTDLQQSLGSLVKDVRDRPEFTLNCMALALHTALCTIIMQNSSSDEAASDSAKEEDGQFDMPKLYIRLFNYEPVVSLKHLKAPLFGKCVAIQGTVVRVNNVKPLVTKMAFRCTVCQGIQSIVLPDGKYTLPSKCPSAECRGKTFIPLRGFPLTETTDWQTIKVQEIARDDQREAGRIPRAIECELTADLVDSCVPGDMVTITAIVKATGSDEGRGRNSKDKCMFLLYLNAVSVINNKSSEDAAHGLHMQFSTKDYYAIKEIHDDQNVFKLIVSSLCPTIYGHELVKAGLTLGLFGGSQRSKDSGSNIPIRADPHILIVGDPGLGKSQMLQAAANIAPRGVYVCGNTSTTSGLTVTLSREGGASGGDYALEAGALVLADQGCCCIDEFDKMGSQHQALLEAMEQQSISIAKAGVVCSLPARTSILAAANPVGGHYNKGKTVSENLKMSSALLSRFDLVFILLDKPDEERDCLLSEHVMSMHAGVQKATACRNLDGSIIETSLSSERSILMLDEDQSLIDKLKVVSRGAGGGGESTDPVPCQLLRKYIGYARKYVHPALSDGAADVLQKFYLELRSHRQSPDSTPITTRQLESLIRLTEARARLELRDVATEQDAKDVVEIMKFSMYDTFSNEFGMVEFQRSQNGSGMSQRSQGKRFISELNRVAEHTASSVFSVQQMKDIAKKIGVQVKSFDDFIFSLNNQNYLLKKGPKLYQLQTASCL